MVLWMKPIVWYDILLVDIWAFICIHIMMTSMQIFFVLSALCEANHDLDYPSTFSSRYIYASTMTSLLKNTFRITAHLRGEIADV